MYLLSFHPDFYYNVSVNHFSPFKCVIAEVSAYFHGNNMIVVWIVDPFTSETVIRLRYFFVLFVQLLLLNITLSMQFQLHWAVYFIFFHEIYVSFAVQLHIYSKWWERNFVRWVANDGNNLAEMKKEKNHLLYYTGKIYRE